MWIFFYLLSRRDGHVRPLREVRQEPQGVGSAELAGVGRPVADDSVEERSGADNESEVQEVLDLLHDQGQEVPAPVDAPLEDADVGPTEAVGRLVEGLLGVGQAPSHRNACRPIIGFFS